MKRGNKLGLFILAFVVAAAFAYAGGPKEIESPTMTAASGEPQYGGRMTVWWHGNAFRADAPSPDIADGYNSQLWWLQPIQEPAVFGDMEKYGPNGTGEYDFTMRNYTPRQFLRGCLLEDWEATPEKLIWNVRQGVRWQGRDVMESRELVAEDMVSDLIHFRNSPPGKTFRDMSTDNIRATDKYTLEIPFSKGFNDNMLYIIGYEDRAQFSPPELLKNDLIKEWENQVGTGPYMFEEYKRGAYILYKKNPIYWDTTTVDGKEYKLPFADEIMHPIIPDESTQIAALKSGKIDWMEAVPPAYWSDLEAVEGLNKLYTLQGSVQGFHLQTQKPPFDNVNVRRAVMIATVQQQFIDAAGLSEFIKDIPENFHPAFPGNPNVYVPVVDLPKDDQLLWKYDANLAKKMLADAGYPNGFKTRLNVESRPDAVERASLLKAQWEKIGVELEINAVDRTAFEEYWYGRNFDGVLALDYQYADLLTALGRYFRTDGVLAASGYSNPQVDGLIDKAFGTIGIEEQTKLAKEAAAIVLHECPFVPALPLAEAFYSWKWLNNTSGCYQNEDWGSPRAVLSRVWMDTAMKKSMGF